MGFFDAFLLAGIFLIGVPVAVLLGVILEKVFGLAWLRVLPFLGVLVAAVAGVPLALHFAGVRTEGRVIARDERVTISWRDASWYSTQRLQVRFLPQHAERADPTTRYSGTDSVTVGMRSTAAAFDGTAVGDVVPVTYVGFRPSVAKLTDRTLGDLWRETMAIGGVPTELAAVGVVILTAFVAARSPTSAAGGRLRRVTLGALAVAILGVGLRIALTSPAHGPDEWMPASATARVARVADFRRGYRSRRGEHLKQPYEVAELVFTPQGARWPVRTADAVDVASVPGLVEGAVVPIHYAPDHPRAARIDGARRTFEVQNGRDTMLQWLAIWSVLIAACCAFWFVMRRRGAAPR